MYTPKVKAEFFSEILANRRLTEYWVTSYVTAAWNCKYNIKYMNRAGAHVVATAFSKTGELCKYVNVFCKKFSKFWLYLISILTLACKRRLHWWASCNSDKQRRSWYFVATQGCCRTLVEPRLSITVNFLLTPFIVIFANGLALHRRLVGMQSQGHYLQWTRLH
jgi:hypothetical protein